MAFDTIIKYVGTHKYLPIDDIEILKLLGSEWLELLIKEAKIGLWDWWILEETIIFNQTWCERVLGYPVDSFKESHVQWKELIHPEDLERVDDNLRKLLKGLCPVQEIDYRIKCADSQWKWVNDIGRILEKNEENRSVRAAGILRDITSSKTLEYGLLQEKARIADLLETTRLINSGISHELRTPLQAIRSVLQIIEEETENGPGCSCPPDQCSFGLFNADLSKYVKDAQVSTDYVISVLNDLALYARAIACEGKKEMEVYKELQGFYYTMKLMEPFKTFSKDKFILDISECTEPCYIRMRAVEFQQIIHNICRNAAEAIETCAAGWIKVSLKHPDPDNIEISIADNGSGIDPEFQDQIFKPYFTTKGSTRENRGLGLSIVQNIIKESEGSISFKTTQGGTEFIVNFPCSTKKEE